MTARSYPIEELRLLVTREKVHDRCTTGCTTGGDHPPQTQKKLSQKARKGIPGCS